MVERQRRDRIERCLEQLKTILLQSDNSVSTYLSLSVILSVLMSYQTLKRHFFLRNSLLFAALHSINNIRLYFSDGAENAGIENAGVEKTAPIAAVENGSN